MPPSNPDPEPRNDGRTALTRIQVQKAKLELQRLKKPLFHRPSVWFAGATALAALITAMTGLMKSDPDDNDPQDSAAVGAQVAASTLLRDFQDVLREFVRKKEELTTIEAELSKKHLEASAAERGLGELESRKRAAEIAIGSILKQESELRAKSVKQPVKIGSGRLMVETEALDGTCFVTATYRPGESPEGSCFTVRPVPCTSRAPVSACGHSLRPSGSLTWGDVGSMTDLVVTTDTDSSTKQGPRITRLLPNPSGPDMEDEAITIENFASESVDMTLWSVRDAAGKSWTLRELGILGSGERKEIKRHGQTMSLNNTGDTISLVDQNGAEVHTVTYALALDGEPVDVVQFVGSKKSSIYHYPTCNAVNFIKLDSLLQYQSAPVGKRLHEGCPW